MLSLHAVGSGLLYFLGWILVWREREDEIKDHKLVSIILFGVFLAITLISDLTPYIPTSVFCAIVWPVFALFVLDIYTTSPYVRYIESELEVISADIEEDQRLINAGGTGIFETASYRRMMHHRRDLLSQIKRAFDIIRD